MIRIKTLITGERKKWSKLLKKGRSGDKNRWRNNHTRASSFELQEPRTIKISYFHDAYFFSLFSGAILCTIRRIKSLPCVFPLFFLSHFFLVLLFQRVLFFFLLHKLLISSARVHVFILFLQLFSRANHLFRSFSSYVYSFLKIFYGLIGT